MDLSKAISRTYMSLSGLSSPDEFLVGLPVVDHMQLPVY